MGGTARRYHASLERTRAELASDDRRHPADGPHAPLGLAGVAARAGACGTRAVVGDLRVEGAHDHVATHHTELALGERAHDARVVELVEGRAKAEVESLVGAAEKLLRWRVLPGHARQDLH